MILMSENFERLWAKCGAIPEKSQTGILRVGGSGYGISRGVIQEAVYQISRG